MNKAMVNDTSITILDYKPHGLFTFFVSGLLLAIMCLTVLSCSRAGTTDKKAQKLMVYITNTKEVKLLPTSEYGRTIDGVFRMLGSYGDNNFSMDTYVLSNKDGIEMEIMSAMGNSLGTIKYKGDKVSARWNLFVSNKYAKYVVSDFQLCFYKESAIKDNIATKGLKLVSAPTGRKIYDGRKLIIDIVRTPRKVVFTNVIRGYSWTILGDFAKATGVQSSPSTGGGE